MGDYGFKTSKNGVNAIAATGSDVIMTTRYPFTKIDQTKIDTFRTTTVSFLTNTANGVDTIVASFDHGYKYKPQVWGLWNVTWSPSLGGHNQNGYGYITNTSGFPSTSLWYEVNETTIDLHIRKFDGFFGTSTIGTTATLTTYVFVDDLTTASYI